MTANHPRWSRDFGLSCANDKGIISNTSRNWKTFVLSIHLIYDVDTLGLSSDNLVPNHQITLKKQAQQNLPIHQ
jgi:hypothetical protein